MKRKSQVDRLHEALRIHTNALSIVLNAPCKGAEAKIFMEVIESMKARGLTLQRKIEAMMPKPVAPPALAAAPEPEPVIASKSA